MASERQRPTPWGLAGILAAWAALTYGSDAPTLQSADTGWHLAAGRWIRANGEIPTSDPWSWTAGDQAWVNLSWAWDVGASAVVDSLGFGALAGLMVLGFAAIPALWVVHLSKRKVGLFALIIAGLLIGFGQYERAVVRPHLVSDLLFMLFYLVLFRDRERGGNGLFALPLLMAAWANIHGGFALGFGLIGAYGLEAAISQDRQRLIRLVGVFAACGLATLCTPLGAGIFSAVGASLDDVNLGITEWEPVVIGKDAFPTLWFLLLLCTWSLRETAAPWADRLIALGLIPLGLSSARHFGPMLIGTLPLLALFIDETLRKLPAAEELGEIEARWTAALSGTAGKRLGLGVVAVAAVLVLPPGHTVLGGPDAHVFPHHSMAPVEVIARMEPPERLFSDYNLGGSLVYAADGRIAPFVDGRGDTAFPKDVLADSIGLVRKPELYAEVFERRKVDAVLLLHSHPLVPVLDEAADWTRADEDAAGVLFLPSTRSSTDP